MSNSEPIELRVEVDPWAKTTGTKPPLPADLRLACAYELHLGVDSLPEAACLHRTDTHDELWTAIIDSSRVSRNAVPVIYEWDELQLAVRAPRGGAPEDAARRLFRHLVRSRTGFAWPTQWHAGDLIDEKTYKQAVAAVKAGLRRNAKAARSRESAIVKAARRLGLGPEPSGTSPTAWQARCPGTNHSLMIGTESNTFGCGYCRRKGGPQELEAFVEDRRLRGVKGGR